MLDTLCLHPPIAHELPRRPLADLLVGLAAWAHSSLGIAPISHCDPAHPSAWQKRPSLRTAWRNISRCWRSGVALAWAWRRLNWRQRFETYWQRLSFSWNRQ
jgi:hypothetical protein